MFRPVSLTLDSTGRQQRCNFHYQLYWKVSKPRLVVTRRDYRDQLIRQAGIERRTGRKWSASQAVEQAETRLRHRDIVGTPCEGRMDLGNNKQSKWKTAEPQERRAMVQQEKRDMEEESRKTKATGQTRVMDKADNP